MLKVKNNVPIGDDEKIKMKWPFHEMKVGSVVDVNDKTLWKRAQKTAHSISSKKNWTVTSLWMGHYGRIRRVK